MIFKDFFFNFLMAYFKNKTIPKNSPKGWVWLMLLRLHPFDMFKYTQNKLPY